MAKPPGIPYISWCPLPVFLVPCLVPAAAVLGAQQGAVGATQGGHSVPIRLDVPVCLGDERLGVALGRDNVVVVGANATLDSKPTLQQGDKIIGVDGHLLEDRQLREFMAQLPQKQTYSLRVLRERRSIIPRSPESSTAAPEISAPATAPPPAKATADNDENRTARLPPFRLDVPISCDQIDHVSADVVNMSNVVVGGGQPTYDRASVLQQGDKIIGVDGRLLEEHPLLNVMKQMPEKQTHNLRVLRERGAPLARTRPTRCRERAPPETGAPHCERRSTGASSHRVSR